MASKAIILVSGGMDSCVTAAMARAENDQLAFLHVSYGQRTEHRERQAFNDIADHYGVTERLDNGHHMQRGVDAQHPIAKFHRRHRNDRRGDRI